MKSSLNQGLFLALLALTIAPLAESSPLQPPSARVIPGEYIITYRSETDANKMHGMQFAASTGIRSITPLGQRSKFALLKTDPKLSSYQSLLNSPDRGVVRIEPNFEIRALNNGESNDPLGKDLWGMDKIKALNVWKNGITGSREIVVAVIDTGILLNHPDLVDNIYVNPGESGDKATNEIDDDQNGYIDDVSGWDFSNQRANGNDDNGHGTHCAGTIGGVGNNQLGVAGVNWKVSLLPVKFLSASGSGSTAGAIESVQYATKMKVHVMSNSWGGGGHSQALEDAIREANAAGIVFIAAAGNESTGAPSYPAAYKVENVVAVAATESNDELASFSNFHASTVHVAAPGVGILSTYLGGGYKRLSGTSMATPHVAGIAALMLSVDGTLAPNEIRRRLIATSDPVAGLKRLVYSNGRVNAHSAVYNIAPPPAPPTQSWKWLEKSASAESPHPYPNRANLKYSFSYPGAKQIRLRFDQYQMRDKDVLRIRDRSGKVIQEFRGVSGSGYSAVIPGDLAVVELQSGMFGRSYGFKVSKMSGYFLTND